MNKDLRIKLALFATVIALINVPARANETLTFEVNIDTAGLSAASSGSPFDLDFQLLFGNSSLASNTATLSNFQFFGGTATGSPVLLGSSTGSLLGSVTLTANSTHTDSEFYQGFQSSVTDISFLATVTETGPDIGTPTEFTASILDNSLGFPAQIYTTAPDTASLIALEINSSNTISDVGYYAGVSLADGNTPLSGVAASVPDRGSTAVLLACSAVALAWFGRRFGLARSQTLGAATSA